VTASATSAAPEGPPATWVLSSHDEVRHVSSFGRPDTGAAALGRHLSRPVADLGREPRRARAAALLTLALPASAYVYQGEELGLAEVEELPREVLQDPTLKRSGHPPSQRTRARHCRSPGPRRTCAGPGQACARAR
jgi:alpha-glucosidase